MTDSTALPDLRIGDLRINPPIIQGGMGVRISGVRLASAVSNEGALGVVASVGTGKTGPIAPSPMRPGRTSAYATCCSTPRH